MGKMCTEHLSWQEFRAKAYSLVQDELSLVGYKSLAKALKDVKPETDQYCKTVFGEEQ